MMKINLLRTLAFAMILGSLPNSLQAQDYRKSKETKRFAQAVNTGENHTLLILDTSWGDTKPEIGDEIAAYDSEGNMVSSVLYVGHHTGLALWGDDEYTKEKEGLSKDEKFHLKWWNKSKDELVSLDVNKFDRGDDTYNKDEISVIAEISTNAILTQEMELFQNVPNPATNHTEVNFYIPAKRDVHLALFNTLGQEILTLAKGKYESGTHKIEINVQSIEAGAYYYNLISGEEKITKQMTIVK